MVDSVGRKPRGYVRARRPHYTGFVEREGRVAIPARFEPDQGGPLRGGGAGGVLEDQPPAFAQRSGANEVRERLRRLARIDQRPGRIGKNEIVGAPRRNAGRRAMDVGKDQPRAMADPERFDVRAERRDGLPRRFDDDDGGRTARERFESQCTRARVEVEHARAIDCARRGQDPEEGLAHPIRSGTRGLSARSAKCARPIHAARYAHEWVTTLASLGFSGRARARGATLDESMLRVAPLTFSVFVAAFLFFVSTGARAQVQPWTQPPLYMLAIGTEDADDEADGLTNALRAYVRSMRGWSLGETVPSFETLAIALRCPKIPDSACLQRIGDQIHAEHYIWGTLARGQRGEVSVELHMWRRGDAALIASAAYSDVLSDSNDPRLRAIAKTLLEKLTETQTTGVVLIAAGTLEGDVIVDGVARGSLKDGRARVVVSEGTHTFEVRGPGVYATPRRLTVAGGTDLSVDFAPAPASDLPPAEEHDERVSYVRPILAYSAIVLGASALVVAGIEGLNWQKDKSANEQDRSNVPSSVRNVCDGSVSAAAEDACDKSRDAKMVSTLGWVFAAAGVALAGAGAWLLATPPRSTERGPAARALRSIELMPQFDAHLRSLDVRVRF